MPCIAPEIEIERRQVDVVLVVRIVQHAVEFDLLDLGHGADGPGTKRRLDVVLALYRKQVPDLERAPAVADEERRVRRHRALVHAEDPTLPMKGSDHTLKRVRARAALGSGTA